MTRAPAIEHAPAKINLALHVLGRRADGFHDIDSLVVFAGIGDRLEFSATNDGLELALDGPFAAALGASSSQAENLVVRAAAAVGEICDALLSGYLWLTKELPVAAGIGGGSADAAAALRLLGRVRGLSDTQLKQLARPLGADVPMCLKSVPLRATGDGNLLSEVSLPSLPMVLVWPAVAVSTAKVFGRLTATMNAPLPAIPSNLQTITDVVGWLVETRNDLERAARLEAPVIDRAIAELSNARASLLARMSGSGSTCFAIFPNLEAAGAAADEIQKAHPDWWVRATMTGAA